MSFSSWFTAPRMKSLAALIPAVASAIAIVIAAVKPTGARVEESSKGYEILRQELLIQHQEIAQMNKSMIELEAWLKVLRDREMMKGQQQLAEKSMLTTSPKPGRNPASVSVAEILLEDPVDLPPVPSVSSVSQPTAPPPANSVFGVTK